jgi:sialate O-acetylesterase
MKLARLAAGVGMALLSLACRADVRLPHVIGDHAVLQRGRPIHLWGWATPGAHLQAHFHQQTASVEVDVIGKWSLFLAPETAGGPYVLTITGDGPQTTISDLLVGDVWFAGGQSNMEMPLSGFPPTASIKDAAKEIAASTNPRIRLLLVEERSSDFPLNDLEETWTLCTPETAKDFSALAYFFGREIAAKENVPIGLIDSSWGGTPADAWTSLDTLGSNAALLPVFASRARFANKLTDVDEVIAAELHADAAAKAAGRALPDHPWHPYETSWLPAGLYNGMIAPYTPYAIKGFLWYQGEADSSFERAPEYRWLFPALIADWRSHWAEGNLPFLYAQISAFNSTGENWGEIRDAQRRTLAVANTAMVVTTDVGVSNNVHPADKQTVAFRMSLAARAMVYGEKLQYQSPLFRQATRDLQADGSTALRVWFDHAEGLNSSDKAVKGFEVAGDDHKFVAAEARVDGSTVVVSAAGVPHPVYVRYAWASFFDTNLYNAAGLPASTFSSDDSPLRP